jgi:ADP-L-glycero-D-manno-heptose 6-epimerase
MFLVTGGAGFIGSNLLAGLEASGATDLVVADRLGDEDKWRNIAKRDLEDIIEPESLVGWIDAMHGRIDCVFHLGAISATTETDADLIVENNFRLSRDIWDRCTRYRIPLVYASSAATYGDGSAGFDDVDTRKALAALRPLNAYGWSKHLFDRWVARHVEAGRGAPPHFAGLKFFNVYGPNEYHKGGMISVPLKNFREISAGGPAVLFRSHRPDYEDGGQMRDFVWVGDCVDAMIFLSQTPTASGLFNLGTGKARSFADLARAVFAGMGRPPEIEFIDTPVAIRDKYQYFTQASMKRLRASGYDRPFTSLEDGVGRYVSEFLATEDPYL